VLGLVVGAAGRAKAGPMFEVDGSYSLAGHFDDVLIPTGQTSVPIPNGYEGFNWSNFSVAKAETLAALNPKGASGVVSPDQAAFNADAGQATITRTNGGTFSLLNEYLTSVTSNQAVEVKGFLNGIMTYDKTYNINTQNPTLVNFANDGFTGIDKVTFTSLGNKPFVMDNVPELDPLSSASALTLLTSGVLMLNGRRKK
jgi:hypothetical protein